MVLGREEGLRADILLVPWLRGEPEHPVPVFFLQRVAEISPAFVGALHDDHAELMESPILVARPRVKEVVVFPEFPDDGGLAILVLAEFRAFDLEEEMICVPVIGLQRIGDGKIRVGVDGGGLEVGLLPVKLQGVFRAELFEGDMKVGNFELVVKRAGAVLGERFGTHGMKIADVFKPRIGEPVNVGHGATLAFKLGVGQAF